MLEEATLASGMRVWTAHPDSTERRPAVLLLHERYGPVEHSFNVVEKMAGEGYVVCVPDVFHRFEGDRGPIERAEDRLDPTDAETLEDLDETLRYLRTLPDVDGSRVGIAGFCLSGRTPLVYAAARDDVTAIVVFHGGIYPRDYDARLPGQETIADVIPRISCPVLGQFGEIDRLVPMENVQRFRRELEASGKSYRVHVYANTPHGWLNTTQPEAHRPEQAARAWSAMVAYFGEVFAGTWEGRRRWEFEADPAVAYDFTG